MSTWWLETTMRMEVISTRWARPAGRVRVACMFSVSCWQAGQETPNRNLNLFPRYTLATSFSKTPREPMKRRSSQKHAMPYCFLLECPDDSLPQLSPQRDACLRVRQLHASIQDTSWAPILAQIPNYTLFTGTAPGKHVGLRERDVPYHCG